MRSLLLAFCLATVTPAVALAAPLDQIKLAQGRVELATKIYAGTFARWQSGQGTLEDVGAWSVRWLGALRDQPTRGKALKRALEAHRDRMKTLEAAVRDRVNAGTSTVIDLEIASYWLVEAELWVLRGK